MPVVLLPRWWLNKAFRLTSSSNDGMQSLIKLLLQKRSISARTTAPAIARASDQGGTKISGAPDCSSRDTVKLGSSSGLSKSSSRSSRAIISGWCTQSSTALGNWAPGRTKRGTYCTKSATRGCGVLLACAPCSTPPFATITSPARV